MKFKFIKTFEDYQPELNHYDNQILNDLQIFYNNLLELGYVERLKFIKDEEAPDESLVTFSVSYPNRIKEGEYKGEPGDVDFSIQSNLDGGYLLSNVTHYAEPTAFEEIPISVHDNMHDKITYLVEGV